MPCVLMQCIEFDHNFWDALVKKKKEVESPVKPPTKRRRLDEHSRLEVEEEEETEEEDEDSSPVPNLFLRRTRRSMYNSRA